MIIAWKVPATTVFTASVMALSVGNRPVPALVWNASASVPTGLYRIHPADPLMVTELVLVLPPEPLAKFLAAGGYLPNRVPMLKRIAALPGQNVCRTGVVVTIDGIPFAEALARDRRGRALPVWEGCVTLEAGQVFLLNSNSPGSLDGRYFGPIPTGSVIGQAKVIWTIGDND